MTDEAQRIEAETRRRLLEQVPSSHQGARRETIKALADSVSPPSQSDRQPKYSARYIRFLFAHWGDTDWEAMRREWLRLGPRQLCDCEIGQTQRVCVQCRHVQARHPSRARVVEKCELCGAAVLEMAYTPQDSRGKHVFESEIPCADTLLDIQRAYAALPLRWESRTVVHLLLSGSNEGQVQHMRTTGAFTWVHRSRIVVEERMPAYRVPRPQDTWPERMSGFRFMASFLSGELDAELRRAA